MSRTATPCTAQSSCGKRSCHRHRLLQTVVQSTGVLRSNQPPERKEEDDHQAVGGGGKRR